KVYSRDEEAALLQDV
nr:EP1=low Mr zona pellucida binding protein {N-terminal} [swine, pH3 extract of cauda epididymal spermatozoa, Peptide Partial, 15 aa] [Sus scrofa]